MNGLSENARKLIIRAAGVLIFLLAFGSAILPTFGDIPARRVIGLLLIAAGAIELVAVLVRRTHRVSASVAAIATVLAGLRLELDPRADFFAVLNMVILWLVVRAAALFMSAQRSRRPLNGWIYLAAMIDLLLGILLLAGLPIALIVYGLFGPAPQIVLTFAWVFATSFIAAGWLLIAAAPLEASEAE
jgi:uncharacterized membrane protein HdeD (DUF308 family)